MYILKLDHHFDAAHRLEFHNGLCKNLHGHRWDVNIIIRTNKLDENGLVIDFGHVKKIINNFDHKTILKNCPKNDKLIDVLLEMKSSVILLDSSPTAENIAKYIKDEIDREFGLNNSEVIVFESPNASIEYYNNEI